MQVILQEVISFNIGRQMAVKINMEGNEANKMCVLEQVATGSN